MKILIYTITDPAPVVTALERAGRFTARVAHSDQDFAAEIATAEALVIGNSRYQSMAATIAAEGRCLRWIQFSSAGIDALKREELRSEIAITRAVGIWTPVVAEHALALSLALLRQLPRYQIQNKERRWVDAGTVGRAQPVGHASAGRRLR